MADYRPLAGKVQTVLGLVEPDTLGVTLPHEHVLVDAGVYFREPTDSAGKMLAHQPVSLTNLSWVRTHRFNNADSLKLTDGQTAIKELTLFARAGGKTVVDVSNIGLGRNPDGLVKIAQATGLNIIMGSGYYIGDSHPEEIASMPVDKIAESISRDITIGVGVNRVKAGVIGEIGCTYPLKDSEKRVLRASGLAQKQTGAPLIIHPAGNDSLWEIISILKESEADLTKTVICHIDIMGFSLDNIRFLADHGCFIELDTFGHLMAPFAFGGQVMDFPSDSQRISLVQQLIKEGLLNQILLSHDTFLKELLTSFGGFGYAHILQNILPVMRVKGITEEQIKMMTVNNPGRLLRY